MRIAFYGKGGIGKSTIAANVSSICAAAGKKVLHIGCDPKADSTRLLVKERIPTVLEMAERKGGDLRREDILFEGKNGVFCLEAGGPQAGIGCAGLGISTAMKELERLEILSQQWDLIVYDVLGDVVCGGFSVPMRKHYVDKVIIVTSADYMSLYAANNILQGALRYSDEKNCLIEGLVLNHIKNENEKKIGALFSEYTKVPYAAIVQESKEMKIADYQELLFTELFPDGANTRELYQLVKQILKESEKERYAGSPRAMTRDELERFRDQIFEKGWVG